MEWSVHQPASWAVEAVFVIHIAKRRDHLSLHVFTTDITPRTIETLVVVNAVVCITSAVEAAGGQQLLTFYTMSKVTIYYKMQGKPSCIKHEQESCAVAKMTTRCVQYKRIEWAVVEIWPFDIIQDGGLPPTWIYVTGNSAIRITHCKDMAIHAIFGAYGTPIFGGRGSRRGSVMAPFKRAIVVSYRLSIATVALSVTI